MTWQEFCEQMIAYETTREAWQAALDHARALLPLVDEADRQQAEDIIGDTLIEAGVFLGYVDDDEETSERMTDPEGEGLADDLIGDDPTPADARRFDENGRRLPQPATKPDPE